MNRLYAVWTFLYGKKTYFAALITFLYGWQTHNTQLMLEALMAAGIRHGLSTEGK